MGVSLKEKYHNLSNFFESAYIEHEKTYDPNHMRDFMDVYMSERMRVTEQEITGSSFYGEAGHWNYLYCMFDLFLVRQSQKSKSRFNSLYSLLIIFAPIITFD